MIFILGLLFIITVISTAAVIGEVMDKELQDKINAINEKD